jgi:hypothetical protein
MNRRQAPDEAHLDRVNLEQVAWPDEPRYRPGRRRAHDDSPVRLVVLGDSFSFTDERGPQMPNTPTLWPNVTAAAISAALDVDVTVTVLARPAQTAVSARELVRKDRHAQFEVLAHADAVVIAIGSYDHAPMGVPSFVEAVVPFVRPPSVRRRVRVGLHAVYPRVVRATRARMARTATAEFTRAYDDVLTHVRGVAHGAAGVALGPSSHRTPYYGGRHPRFAEREQLQLELAASQGFAPVAAWLHVEPVVDQLNVDGIHWPRVAHAAVGASVAASLIVQLGGTSDRPPRPGRRD